VNPSLIPELVRAVQAGVRWLRSRADSLTDPREVAVALVALVDAERSPRGHLAQKLASNLLRRQSASGSWSEELWDTTWAMRALLAAGYARNHPAIESGVHFLVATEDPERGAWYEEPFETTLVLELLADLAPDHLRGSGARALDWLFSLQREDGAVIGVRYTGMAASLVRALPQDIRPRFEPAAARALAWLRADIAARTIWTGAAWSNYYALRALLDFGATLDDPTVEKAARWFLRAQDPNGQWMQVSRVHDTAMAVAVLSRLLSVPMIEIAAAKTGVVSALRENGTLRIAFQAPGAGAIMPNERLKLSEEVRLELSRNQEHIFALAGAMRTARSRSGTAGPRARPSRAPEQELVKVGRYAYGHLFPARIKMLLESSVADHVRFDVDERLIDLPWELLHDGSDFLCMAYAVGRRIVSDQAFAATRELVNSERARVLIVADPTSDLPAAATEGARICELLEKVPGMDVTTAFGPTMTKKDFLLCLSDYEIVHFAGHARHDPKVPDESCLCLCDGDVRAFEMSRFIGSRPPAVVFLNACWSAEETVGSSALTAVVRGLGRTLLYSGVAAFLGYLVPVPDDSATDLAVTFYTCLAQGHTIGESLRRARVENRTSWGAEDITWSSAVLYGDPSVRAFGPT
jgi:hypothetical protein